MPDHIVDEQFYRSSNLIFPFEIRCFCQEAPAKGQNGWRNDDADDRKGPEPGCRRKNPTIEKDHKHRLWHNASTKIVKDLPAG
mgnify:FL=1